MYGKEQIEFLKNKKYLLEGETLEQRISEIVNVVKKYEHNYRVGLADSIKFLIENQILSLSTPQWSNLGRVVEDGSTPLPVSCNIISYPDSISGIYYSHGEAAMLSKLGAGVGASFLEVSNIGTPLSEGFFSNPKLDWIEDFVSTTQKVSQGAQRRGYGVPFMSIDDPEFYKLLERASKTNPDKHDPLVENNIGIVLPIGFRERVKNGDTEARKRLLLVLEERKETGKIYLVDIENMNKNTSPVYKKLNQVVNSTNICLEVMTPSYKDKTFACVIASLNATKWDIIKENPQYIKDAYMFLDIVVEEYIRLTEGIPFLEKARHSAIEKRDIGLGLLGFHELLQMNRLSYGSLGSRILNKEIFSTIRECGEEVTVEMAEKLGSPKMCKEAGLVRRNVSLMMVAPNKSCATPDTRFLDEKGLPINYYEFCERGGVDIEDMMSITLHLDNGDVIKLKHDSKVKVLKDDVVITKEAKFLTEEDEFNSKNKRILKIENNSGKWFNLKNKVGVETNDGVKNCEKIFFNGFEPVFKVEFSDGVSERFTANHKLMLNNGNWARIDELTIGSVLNTGTVLTAIEQAGIEPTMDMEVPDVHYYLLSNKVMSHNTSFICGNTTPGIEPNRSNTFVKALSGIQTVVKNKYLKEDLEKLGKNTPEIWDSIVQNLGSVQHLDFLDNNLKAVYKTATEISPKDMIDLASDRQVYIDMGQSLNLFNRPNYTMKDIYDIHMYAFNKDIKTLYYFYPQAHSAFEVDGEAWDTCDSCSD